MQPVAPLTIHLKPSRRLLVIQVAAHLVAAVAVMTAAISGWIAALLLATLGYSFSRVRNARLPAFIGADGTATEAQVHPHTVVLAELIVLLCRQQGGIGALALLGDSLSAADARELRLWLRWRAQETRAA
jgi:hypothetical protein